MAPPNKPNTGYKGQGGNKRAASPRIHDHSDRGRDPSGPSKRRATVGDNDEPAHKGGQAHRDSTSRGESSQGVRRDNDDHGLSHPLPPRPPTPSIWGTARRSRSSLPSRPPSSSKRGYSPRAPSAGPSSRGSSPSGHPRSGGSNTGRSHSASGRDRRSSISGPSRGSHDGPSAYRQEHPAQPRVPAPATQPPAGRRPASRSVPLNPFSERPHTARQGMSRAAANKAVADRAANIAAVERAAKRAAADRAAIATKKAANEKAAAKKAAADRAAAAYNGSLYAPAQMPAAFRRGAAADGAAAASSGSLYAPEQMPAAFRRSAAGDSAAAASTDSLYAPEQMPAAFRRTPPATGQPLRLWALSDPVPPADLSAGTQDDIRETIEKDPDHEHDPVLDSDSDHFDDQETSSGITERDVRFALNDGMIPGDGDDINESDRLFVEDYISFAILSNRIRWMEKEREAFEVHLIRLEMVVPVHHWFPEGEEAAKVDADTLSITKEEEQAIKDMLYIYKRIAKLEDCISASREKLREIDITEPGNALPLEEAEKDVFDSDYTLEQALRRDSPVQRGTQRGTRRIFVGPGEVGYGIPIARMTEKSKNWNSKWVSLKGGEFDVEKAIVNLQDAKHELENLALDVPLHVKKEAENKVYREHTALAQICLIRRFFADGYTIHPNQLVSPEQLPPDGLYKRRVLYIICLCLRRLLTIRDDGHPIGLRMSPVDFLRWRMAVICRNHRHAEGRGDIRECFERLYCAKWGERSDPDDALFREVILEGIRMEEAPRRYV